MGRYLVQRNMLRIILITFVIMINVGCDQISKNLVRDRLHYYQKISLVKDYFTLTKVENTGAFLGLGSNFPPLIKKVIFSILPAAVLVIALFVLLSKLNLGFYAIFGLCFMIGGGVGNVIDRIRYESVTDFLHIDLGIVSTGIFNLADVSIMLGLALLTIQHFFPKANTISASTGSPEDS
ncbi:signal peptidase II [Fulvivirgaceae bacterium BMA12]|uniref:Lipoprotein signal peptidase n=1 Tax=Agaribacillus aureus TaxID=3051825 RepID=A0ABT8L023_9BACT|nr:signal peptidase II [Fulvivirgaceae bacterium BMA12]